MQYINSIMQKSNRKQTYGIVALKDGSMINIYYDFDKLINLWRTYKFAQVTKNKELMTKIMNNTGGIVDTADALIDITRITAVMPVSNYYENDKVKQEIEERSEKMRYYLMQKFNLDLFSENLFTDNEDDD